MMMQDFQFNCNPSVVFKFHAGNKLDLMSLKKLSPKYFFSTSITTPHKAKIYLFKQALELVFY